MKRHEELNQKLKAVKSHEDFKAWDKELIKALFYHHIELRGKRRGYEAYAFTPYPPNPTKAHYLYADSKSTGVCRWENLYKYLEVWTWEE